MIYGMPDPSYPSGARRDCPEVGTKQAIRLAG
jgi:hypothetical protein